MVLRARSEALVTPRNFGHGLLRGAHLIVVVAVVAMSSTPPFACSFSLCRFHPGTCHKLCSGHSRSSKSGWMTRISRECGGRRKCQSERLPLAAAKKNYGNDLEDFCTKQEARAMAAVESWIVDATGFLEPEQSSALLATLEGRADVSCCAVGSYRGSSSSSNNNKRGTRRVRCVFSNPDLAYDETTAESDYVSYLKVTNVVLSECDPWPNILVKIGLSLDTVGDVSLVEGNGSVFLAVAPESEKPCIRLLPKELPGNGVTVTKLSRDEMDTEMAGISESDGEVVQDMQTQRVDKRKQ